MTDRTTKVLLAAIAAGLWLNVIVPQIRPVKADAREMENYLSQISHNTRALSDGNCNNKRLC